MRITPSSKPFRSAAGFTMVEIAICLAVIGFALVAIIGVLPIGMNVQKDNREETVINFDANYLMNAIRNGSLGQNELTNYIYVVTNISTTYNTNASGQYVLDTSSTNISWYTNSPTPPFGQIGTFVLTNNVLSNSASIIGLLSTPKYIDAVNGGYISNYVTADFRSITGSPVDHGVSQSSRDFAFSYRLYPEIVPFGTPDQTINLAPPMGITFSRNLQNNFHEIRLRFRWPIVGNGTLGTGLQVYRTSASGAMLVSGGLYFFQPQGYTNLNLAYTNSIP